MCGIAGIISKTHIVDVKSAIYAMSKSIKHRGPDGEGFVFISATKSLSAYSDETPVNTINNTKQPYYPTTAYQNVDANFNLALAHRRLSIIDLSETGHQPMCDDQDNWITFNGEIYNYIELRNELLHKGHSFISNTDTEVVLKAYQEWGTDCLSRFNGMWAFVLYDKKNAQLFAARDRVGVKPFYYINTPNVFAFASEIKTFIKSNLCEFSINETQQFDFLINSNLETESEGLVKQVIELKPAHYFIYNLHTHSIKTEKFYELPHQKNTLATDQELIDNIEQHLINAVNLRLRSDVEIGSCLSGGLDSTVIAGLMRYLNKDSDIKLFSAVFPGKSFNEEVYANIASKHVNGNLKTVTPTATDFFRDVRELNYFQDMPVWSTSTYAQHRVMKLAADNGVKVVLDGQGADEIFAGYAHHYMALWKEQFSITNAYQTIKDINDAKLTVAKPYNQFAKQLIKDSIDVGIDYSDYFNKIKNTYTVAKPDKIKKSLNEQLKYDYQNRLKSFLKCEDRCSMAFGIESRVPFADDVDLVNLLFSIQGNKKIKQGVSKYLLRQAMAKYIPAEIKNRRDKIGFESPLGEWLKQSKNEVLETIVDQMDYVNRDKVYKKFDYLCESKSTFLFRLYSFSVWKEVFKKL